MKFKLDKFKNKEKIKKPIYKRIWFILSMIISMLFVLFIVIGIVGSKFDWNDIVLRGMLPQPASETGSIKINTSSELLLEVWRYSDDKYSDYVDTCKEKGFNIDSYISNFEYEANNADGYKLNVEFDDGNNYLIINLTEPLKMNSIHWTGQGMARLIPAPLSKVGVLKNESSSEYYAFFGETDINEYYSYVDACIEKGFNIDYEKTDRLYKAYDENANYLEVKYEGINIMSVKIIKAKEIPTESSTENAETSLTTLEPTTETTKPTTTELETTKEFTTTKPSTTKRETTTSKQTTTKKVTTTKRVTTTKNPDSQKTVYYTKSGEKYHYKNPCGRGTYYPCTLEEAKDRGLEPCEKCVLH